MQALLDEREAGGVGDLAQVALRLLDADDVGVRGADRRGDLTRID